MSSISRFAGALALVLLCATDTLASELFSVNFPFEATLYRMDQSTGAASAIGLTGTSDIGDLTSDTRSGSFSLWGVNIFANALVTLNPATGATTTTVPITGTLPNALGAPGLITSLAFDGVTGALYGNTTVSFGDSADRLYRIDPATGVATIVGATGRIGFENVFALGFDQAGNLFGIADTTNELISISTLTGAGSLIAGVGLESSFDIASRPEDNTMFLVDSGFGTFSLYTINTGTAAVTLVGGYGGANPNLVGLAFSAVPEPTTVLLLVSGLAGLGLAGRRWK